MASDIRVRLCAKCGSAVSSVKCPTCNYVDLDLVEDAPEPESESSAAAWQCRCGFAGNSIEETLCQRCGKSPFEETKSGITDMISGWFGREKKTWVCAWCRYEYNTQSACQKCGHGQNSAPSEAMWSCLNCSRRNNNSKEHCEECGCGVNWENYLEYHGIRVNSEGKQWMCPGCYYANEMGSVNCEKCGEVPRPVQELMGRVERPTWLSWLR